MRDIASFLSARCSFETVEGKIKDAGESTVSPSDVGTNNGPERHNGFKRDKTGKLISGGLIDWSRLKIGTQLAEGHQFKGKSGSNVS